MWWPWQMITWCGIPYWMTQSSKPAKRPLSGNNGLVELDLADRGGRDLFACFEDWVIQYGMPHHVIICQGHHKASLAKFAAARGVKVV